MTAVIEHSTRLVDDPARVGPVAKLGFEETSFLATVLIDKAISGCPTDDVAEIVSLGETRERIGVVLRSKQVAGRGLHGRSVETLDELLNLGVVQP